MMASFKDFLLKTLRIYGSVRCRLKVPLEDSSQGTRSPSRPAKRVDQSDVRVHWWPLCGSWCRSCGVLVEVLKLVQEENVISTSVSGRSDDINCMCSSGAFDISRRSLGSSDNWTVLPTEGHKPAPRFHVMGCLLLTTLNLLFMMLIPFCLRWSLLYFLIRNPIKWFCFQ